MMEKRIVELLIVLAFLVLIFVLERKKVVYLLILILPVTLNSRFGEINIYLIFFVYILMFLRNLGRAGKGYQNKAIPIFFSLFLFSYLISFMYNRSVLEFSSGLLQSPYFISFATLASCMALFLMIVKNINTVDDVKNSIKFIFAAYLISSIASILVIIDPSKLYFFEYLTHYQTGADQAGRGGIRVYGTLGEYELYAEYSAIILLLLFYSLLEMSSNIRKKVLYSSMVFLVLFLLFMTKTRGPLVALALVLGYLAVFKGRQIGVGRNLMLASVISAIVVIVYVIISANSQYNVIDHLFSTKIDVEKGSFDTRSATWQYGFEHFLSGELLQKVIGLGPGIISHTPQLLVFPHSLYLYLLISLGIFGFLVYVGWFGWLYMDKIKTSDRSILTLSIFLKAVLLLFLIDQFKIEFIRNSRYQQMIWVFFALLYVVNKKIPSMAKQEKVSVKTKESPRLLS